jgi:sorbitol/mannitol transport system permease protein
VTIVAAALIWKTTILDAKRHLELGAIAGGDWQGGLDRDSGRHGDGRADWQWTPFMMLLTLAGLQSMPRDILRPSRRCAFQLFRE